MVTWLFLSLGAGPLAHASPPASCDALFESTSKISPDAPPWFATLKFRATEHILKRDEIVSTTPLHAFLESEGRRPSGSTQGIALVTLRSGVQAVWKPGENNLSEVGAYKAARLTGSRLIPPTVDRVIEGQIGSLQYYVKTNVDLKKMTKSERQETWHRVSASQRVERDLYNFVFGNWDLHQGNVLIDPSFSIVQIDNALIRTRQHVRYGELPFIRRFKVRKEVSTTSSETPFPFEESVFLQKPSLAELESFLKPFVSPEDLERFIKAREEGSDLTMRVAFWDHAVWIQAIGYQNYGPIRLQRRPGDRILEGYRSLNFMNLREALPRAFSDQHVREIVERRDLILAEFRK